MFVFPDVAEAEKWLEKIKAEICIEDAERLLAALRARGDILFAELRLARLKACYGIADDDESFAELRYNHNHDPKNGRFTSGSSSAGLTGGGAGDIIKENIKNGSIKLEINHEKQARHIKGSGYIKGRSYLTISESEAREIVNKQHGTGYIHIYGNGQIKETITCDKIIGVDVNRVTKAETPTNSVKIHYSKTGTHIVPTRRKEEKDD
ncbi:MAG: polymorphic toxin type 50 domain-containing protein [Prevotella sp.]|nr:polymorphic toxin type 50 domain-containing protein [Prevotella sp.]